MASADHRAWRRLAVVIVAGLATSVLLVAIRRPEPRPALPGPSGALVSASGVRRGAAGRVTYVYDGDTIEVEGVGKVRLLGIDALDGYNEERMAAQAVRYDMPPARVRYWAETATQFARRTLDGCRVRLEYGPEATDYYGRTLAYVRIGAAAGGPGTHEAGEQDFDLLMLQEGLAAAYRAAQHPRREEYLAAEARAQAAGVGLWQDAKAQP